VLSIAEMILPEEHSGRRSPDAYMERPPSPPVLYTSMEPAEVKLDSASQRRRESPSRTRHAPAHDDPVASSPTIQNGLSSGSPDSVDFDRWPGFDGHDAFDDSGLGLEEQEKGSSGSDDSSSGSDDPRSSAALSRRAEIILANAKKRLNLMEGNLRGARESLVVSPTSYTPRSPSALSLHMQTTRDRDRRLYAGMGPIPPSGHARNLSETAAASPAHSQLSRAPSKRASSAIGHSGAFGYGRFPIKESRSHDVLRDTARASSRRSRSPPALETLQEDEQRVHRTTSAASGLRDQMNDLKGRISSLKMRAHEDQLRRRSMQSLRASSPFTNAQEWSVSGNAGLGITAESPPATSSVQHGENLVAQDKDFDDLESYHDEEDFDGADDGEFLSVSGDDAENVGDSVYEDAVYEMAATERHEDRIDAFDYEHFFLHSAMGTYSLEGRRSSTGSDSSTATTRPVTSVPAHGDDMSSAEKRVSYHARNPSSDSVSTVASFATAAEEQDDDEENEQMDQFSQQILAQQRPATSRPVASNSSTSLRSDSAINMRRATGTSPSQTILSRGSASPADLASGLQVSKIFSILTESSSPSYDAPRLALNEEEKQLIYSLAASFQQVCSSLQHASADQYERKAWRRRLDEARRVLNGDDAENDDSF
jgi:hypothetical protein